MTHIFIPRKSSIGYGSFIFNGSDEYLSHTISSGGAARTKATWSFWSKAVSQTDYLLMSQMTASNGAQTSSSDTESILWYAVVASTPTQWLYTAADVFEDDGAWHHYVLVYDSTQATEANRLKLLVDGVSKTLTVYSGLNISLNETIPIVGTGVVMNLGGKVGVFTAQSMAFMEFCDSVAAAATDFAYDNGGTWTAKKYAGSYGTYGYRLDGTDGFNDTSGVGTDFTGTNMTVGDNISHSDLPPYTS